MLRFLAWLAASALLGVLPLASIAQDPPSLRVPTGFAIERIATVDGARELAVTPNGDLLVGTYGHEVAIVPSAEGKPGAPHSFLRLDDQPVAGVALAGDTLYIGAQFGVWRVPYRTGDRTARAAPERIAQVRPSGIARDHLTTTVAVAKGVLYASVGSSCDSCDPDLDATRATIQQVDGGKLVPRARRIRNAIALTTNQATGTLWAGDAGQDRLPPGHPYELFDPVTLHPGVADYGWPDCYENARPARGGGCSGVVVPRIVFPAYDTPIGAVFYPKEPSGPHAFPAEYRGGAFVTLHGSWHRPLVPPRVVFVPMNGDEPKTPVDWNDPERQWREFVGGFQSDGGGRLARPTGIAVGTDGSLFVADDQSGGIFRIRPRGAGG
jgi:glucose/arabinose dehydrogenase